MSTIQEHVIGKIQRYSFAAAKLSSVLKVHVHVGLAAVPGVADVANNLAFAHIMSRSHSNRARPEMQDEEVLAGGDLEDDPISALPYPISAGRRRIWISVVNIDDVSGRGGMDGTIVDMIISQRHRAATMSEAANCDK